MGKHTPDELISKLSNFINKSKEGPTVRLTITRSSQVFTSVNKPSRLCYKKKRLFIKEQLKNQATNAEADPASYDLAARVKVGNKKCTATV
jgi:hypothetical protein